jgi:site-specific DNA recombinase
LVKENIILSPEFRSHEKLMHGIKVLMAKNYVENLGEETKKGMAAKAKQGIWPSFAPPGYRNVIGADGRRAIEPDPIDGPVITRLFARFAQGDVSIKMCWRASSHDSWPAALPRADSPGPAQADLHGRLRLRRHHI